MKTLKQQSALHLVLLTILLTTTMANAYPTGWSDDILINQDTRYDQYEPDIDVDGYKNVWISWDSATLSSGEIYYSKRDSLGNCLIPDAVVSNNPTKSFIARIAVDRSNNVHFIWRDESSEGLGIWHAKLANDGSTLVSSHLAVAGAGGMTSTLQPAIAVTKYNELIVAWDERTSGYNQVNYTRLDSVGNPIAAKIRVSPVGLNAYWLGMGIDSFANAHIAYRTDTTGSSYRLTYTKADRNGNIVIPIKILGFGAEPSFVADRSQNIHMIYSNPVGPGNKIEYLKINQNGDILIGPIIISIPQISSNTYNDFAIDSFQYLHAVWQADSETYVSTMYTKMDTMGNFVIPPMRIVYRPYTLRTELPRIAVAPGNKLHVAWIDGRLGSADVFYKHTTGEIGIIDALWIDRPPPLFLRVSPNPFWSKTTISGFSESTAPHCLTIYDAAGRIVKTISADKNTIVWDGSSNTGEPLPPGVYLIRYVKDKTFVTEKVIKCKN